MILKLLLIFFFLLPLNEVFGTYTLVVLPNDRKLGLESRLGNFIAIPKAFISLYEQDLASMFTFLKDNEESTINWEGGSNPYRNFTAAFELGIEAMFEHRGVFSLEMIASEAAKIMSEISGAWPGEYLGFFAIELDNQKFFIVSILQGFEPRKGIIIDTLKEIIIPFKEVEFSNNPLEPSGYFDSSKQSRDRNLIGFLRNVLQEAQK